MRQRGLITQPRPTQSDEGPTDAELTGRAADGEVAAFEELYRRHVGAAWRVAQAVTGNVHDAADAVSDAFTRVFQALPARLREGDHFRPYLLTSTRNAAIDVLRRSGRLSPTEAEQMDRPAVGNEPAELMVGDADSSMVTRAFRSLPERWRSVLWLTEVEGIPPREAAGVLGLSPNGVAQLAVRARAGLRERFLQAHLGEGEVLTECRSTVDRLGAYVAGGLAPRDVAKVDQHLAGCAACTGRQAQLAEISPALLRRAALPLPAGLAAMVIARWELAGTGAGAGAATTAGVSTSGAAAGSGLAAGGTATGTGLAAGSGALTAAGMGVAASTGVFAAAAAPAALGLGGLAAASAAPVAAFATVALFVAGVVGASTGIDGASWSSGLMAAGAARIAVGRPP
ncbi:MAG TPA: sigma-70 family RNA polymerase sigma factor, partial [Acidimicrobiales bacterium]|nr:sigma-70 family RNA polymerase sigma factor [Acidimicrobiales bacterium]